MNNQEAENLEQAQESAEPVRVPRAVYLGTHPEALQIEGFGRVQAGEGERLVVFLVSGWEQDTGGELVRRMEACADPLRDPLAVAKRKGARAK